MPIGQCAPHCKPFDAGAGLREQAGGDVALDVAAVMRRGGQRQLFVVDRQAVARAGQAERQRLQRLDCRARERDHLRIAERMDDAAVTVDDGRGDEMPGVDAVAARDHDRGGWERARGSSPGL
jgi:hypothetical protein